MLTESLSEGNASLLGGGAGGGPELLLPCWRGARERWREEPPLEGRYCCCCCCCCWGGMLGLGCCCCCCCAKGPHRKSVGGPSATLHPK